MFTSSSPFYNLPKERQDQIIFEARTKGTTITSRKYAEEVGLNEAAFRVFLVRKMKPKEKEPIAEEPQLVSETKLGRIPKPKVKIVDKTKKIKSLSKEENDMLARLEAGTSGIDEMSRMVAVRVFKRMLQNPDDFRFIDFFRAELLRQKEQETKLKYKWTNELMARMFAGQLPPKICPNCGMHLVKEVIEGSEETNGQVSIDGDIVTEESV